MDRTSQFLNKTILVVGGTGFLGFHIASSLCKFGANVYSLSQRPPGKHRHLNIQYLYHDLSIPFPSHPIRSIKFDYIFNCSGYVDHSSFFDGGSNVISTNINSVLHLIETLNWSSVISFVQFGSSDEYGSISPPQSESCTPIPLTPYSLSKFSITNLLRSLSISENLPFIIVRPFLVYGPHQDSNRLFPYVINNCISDSTFTLTSGLQLRDFLYIDDFVEAVLCLACTPKALGSVFNIGSGSPISVRDVVLLIQSIIGLGSPVFGTLPLRTTESPSLYADISLISQLTEWTPSISLNDGLNYTINYYKTLLD